MVSEFLEIMKKNQSLILVILFFISVASIIGFIHLIVIPSYESRPACCGPILGGVNASRVSDDTIKLTVVGGNEYDYYNAPILVMIYINEKELSNMSVITEQGLQDTIDPPNGLVFKNGNSAIISGIDVTKNLEKPFKLKVITRQINPLRWMVRMDKYI